MASEEWRIILSEEYTGGGGVGIATAPSAGGTAQATKASEEASKTIVGAKPYFQNAGKMAAVLAGSAGAIAFIIQMIRRSKVFSTFMDNFLMILSTVVDILMLPLIPILFPVLNWFMKLIPLALEASKAVSNFLKNPWEGIKNIFGGIGGAITKIGNFFGGTLGDIGTKVGDMVTNIGGKLGDAGQKIWNILTASGISFWDKIKAVGEVAWKTILDIWNKDIVPTMKSVWDKDIAPWIKNVWDTKIVPWIQQGFTTFVTWAIGEFPKWMKSFLDVFVTLIPAILSAICTGIGNWIKGELSGNPIYEAVQGVKKFFTGKGFQFGTSFVPQTGMYMLHRGEQVTPSNRSYNKSNNITNIFNISSDVKEQAKRIASTLDDQMRATSLSGW